MSICIRGGRVVKDDGLINEELWIKEGRISSPLAKADQVIQADGLIISPGLIDIQINGAHGFDITSNPHSITEIAKHLPRYGVTSFLATVISSSSEHYHNNLPHLQFCTNEEKSAEVLGIHLEGPLLANSRTCAHPSQYLMHLSTNSILPEEFYGSLNGVKLVTLAPEIPGALEWIKALNRKGIIVSAGHSEASFNEMEIAVSTGVGLSTHLFNAMKPMHHRDPGLVGYVLNHTMLPFTLIADPAHVSPAIVQLTWKLRKDGVILISDSVSALGMPPGDYPLGTQTIHLENHVSTLKDEKTLAGSILSLDLAMRNLIDMTGCSPFEAIETASCRPAKLLGLENKGSLDVGADADVTVFTPDLHVKTCIVRGKIAYRAH